jgi:hypothetical protein
MPIGRRGGGSKLGRGKFPGGWGQILGASKFTNSGTIDLGNEGQIIW